MRNIFKVFLVTVFSIKIAFAVGSFEQIPMPPSIQNVTTPKLVILENNPYGNSAYTIEGNFLANGESNISIIDLDDTIYDTSKIVDNKYKLFFPELTDDKKEYIVKVGNENVEYYLDFLDGKVNYKTIDDLIVVDNNYTNLNKLIIEKGNRYSNIDVDLSLIDSNKYILSGNISTDYDGEITITATDKTSGLKYTTTTTNKTYNMKLLNESTDYVFTLSWKEDDSTKTVIVQNDGSVISSQNIQEVGTTNGESVYLTNTIPLLSTNEINIDTTTFKENTFSFDLSSMTLFTENPNLDYYSCRIYLLDETQRVVANTGYISNCQKGANNIAFNMGSLSGNFVLRLDQSVQYKDANYERNSYYIGANNQVVHVKDLPFSQVTPIEIPDNNYNISIDLNAYIPPTKYKVDGSFNGITNGSINFYNPIKRLNYSADIKNEIYSLSVPAGKYIVKVYDDNSNEFTLSSLDGDYSSSVTYLNAEDIKWGSYDLEGNLLPPRTDYAQIDYFAPSNIDMMVLSENITIPKLTLTPLTYKDLTVKISGLTDQVGKTAIMEVSRKDDYKRFSHALKIESANLDFVFANLRSANDYVISLNIEGNKRLYYNTNTSSWTENAYYLGYQNNVMCEDFKNFKYDCNKDKVIQYKINLDGITLPDSAISVAFPEKKKIEGILSLGTDLRNKEVYVSISGNGIYSSIKKEIDSKGLVPFSFEVAPESGYRVYIFVNYKSYAIEYDGNVYKLIMSNNAFNSLGQVKTSVKLDARKDLNIGTLELPKMRVITFDISNLEANDTGFKESLMISLSGTNGWYSEHAYSNESGKASLEIKAPSGDYYVSVFPSRNKSGMVKDDSMNSINLSTQEAILTWNKKDATLLTLNSDMIIPLTLKSLDSFKSITGNVALGEGYICAKGINFSDGKCSKVDRNNNFKLDGLSPTGDYKYLLEYWSNNGEIIREVLTMVGGNNLVDVSFDLKDEKKITVNGSIQYNTSKSIEVILIEVDNDNKWKVIDSKSISNPKSSTFKFENIPVALDGYHYEVIVAEPTMDEYGRTSYTMYEARKLDNNAGTAENISTNSNVTISIGE